MNREWKWRYVASAAIAFAGGIGICAQERGASTDAHEQHADLTHINHFVVIYQENHSFDNLFGQWEGIDGLRNAEPARTTQINQLGAPYGCLKQNDPNLTSPPLPATCLDPANGVTSAFTNKPFNIDQYISADAHTCPNGTPSGAPGGCTRDLVHRFYQEQYQLHGGQQDRYVTGSDAIGLTMGYYSTRDLPLYRYLHGEEHPHYAIADRFFQSAFGGSFLNHQWLIAARAPVFAGAVSDGTSNDLHSIVDANGMPTTYPLYTPTQTVKDGALTTRCPAALPGLACGDYAINTIQPMSQPYAPGTAVTRRLPALTYGTIGDRLTAAGIDWAWYSGGWSNADGRVGAPGWTNGTGPTCSDPATASGAVYPNCPNNLFQYHHQAFNYFAAYAPGTSARAQHLLDEQQFIDLAGASTETCELKSVSFIKPIGAENEHPGYTGESQGSQHIVQLLQAIENGACARDTMVILTYDEFGGTWDHVPPPGQGNNDGPHDQWGPGTRIPALIVSPRLRGEEVIDHTSYDTTSILATLEKRYGLAPLGTRDALVNDFSSVFDAREIGNARR